jgi:hypothetical protein
MRTSFSLDASPTCLCDECGRRVETGWRDVKVTWDVIVRAAIRPMGIPFSFGTRDFLIEMSFWDGRVRLVFCGQGPRRGEVQLIAGLEDVPAQQQITWFVAALAEKLEVVEQ